MGTALCLEIDDHPAPCLSCEDFARQRWHVVQEALGYDLAQSLFAKQRNLVLESLTDFWYLEATSELLGSAGLGDLNERIELIPCTIVLHLRPGLYVHGQLQLASSPPASQHLVPGTRPNLRVATSRRVAPRAISASPPPASGPGAA